MRDLSFILGIPLINALWVRKAVASKRFVSLRKVVYDRPDAEPYICRPAIYLRSINHRDI